MRELRICVLAGWRHGYWFGPNCINRYVNDSVSVMAGQAYIDWCKQKQTFAEFWPCFERCPHRSGHGAIGGKVGVFPPSLFSFFFFFFLSRFSLLSH